MVILVPLEYVPIEKERVGERERGGGEGRDRGEKADWGAGTTESGTG